MKPKKKTRKKRGHRQEITRLMINSIHLNGEILAIEEQVINDTDSNSIGEESLSQTPVVEESAAE